jgi:hypothetical protein
MSDNPMKLLEKMIELDGFITYNGYILFKSEVEDNGFVVGKMTGEHFKHDRRFGHNLKDAIIYLSEREKE